MCKTLCCVPFSNCLVDQCCLLSAFAAEIVRFIQPSPKQICGTLAALRYSGLCNGFGCYARLTPRIYTVGNTALISKPGAFRPYPKLFSNYFHDDVD